MNLTMELPDDLGAALQAQAQGVSPGRIVSRALEGVLSRPPRNGGIEPPANDSVVERMRALRARVKPHPEGSAARDNINHGCR